MKYYLRITYYGTIAKLLNTRQDLTLITDSQNVIAIKEHLAGTDQRQLKKLKNYNLFLLKVTDGDYSEIYASTHSVAWLNAHIDKIVPIISN